MGLWSKLKGTTTSLFGIGISGPTLKNNAGVLEVRNAADSAYAEATASKVNVTGNDVVLNSDAAGAGADWKITISRPSSGMTADVALTLPVDDGSPNQVLQTNGSGVLSWASTGSTADLIHVDTTTLNFGDSSPKTLFTLPANAVVHDVQVIIDTAFNGTAPTLSIGLNGGSASKYQGTADNNLKGAAKDVYGNNPGEVANGSTEALEGYYVADGSSAGAARILVMYSNPA